MLKLISASHQLFYGVNCFQYQNIHFLFHFPEVSFVDATYFASAASTSVDIFVQASYPVNAATTVSK